MELILASGSPRRLELLRQIGLEPRVAVSRGEEEKNDVTPEQLVRTNALNKGREVRERGPGTARGSGTHPGRGYGGGFGRRNPGQAPGPGRGSRHAPEAQRPAAPGTDGSGPVLQGAGAHPCGNHRGGIRLFDGKRYCLVHRHRGTHGQSRCLRHPGQSRPVHPGHPGVLQQCGGAAPGTFEEIIRRTGRDKL